MTVQELIDRLNSLREEEKKLEIFFRDFPINGAAYDYLYDEITGEKLEFVEMW